MNAELVANTTIIPIPCFAGMYDALTDSKIGLASIPLATVTTACVKDTTGMVGLFQSPFYYALGYVGGTIMKYSNSPVIDLRF